MSIFHARPIRASVFLPTVFLPTVFLPTVFVALALSAPAAATPALDVTLPAGTACEFELRITGAEDDRVARQFTDRAGNTVRTITAGRGPALTFTNTSTGETLALRGNGSVEQRTTNPDGSSTVSVTGHNVIILFPTDVPAGPTTTLYTGRVTYTATVTNDFTILSTAGGTRDICAELA